MAGIRHGSATKAGARARSAGTRRGPHRGLPIACWRCPPRSAKEVASDASGCRWPASARIIDELEQLGLLARQASQSDRVVASPPAIALKPLLLERERGLTRAHEALLDLSELYRESAEQRNAADVVDVILGVGCRAPAHRRSCRRPRRARCACSCSATSRSSTADENVEEDRALARGVRYRVIVESGVLERPGFLDGGARGGAGRRGGPGAADAADAAVHRRRLDGAAADALARRGAFGGRPARAIPSGLLDLVMAIFEEYWSSATDFLSDDAASDGHRRASTGDLLKLLLLGLTDATVAAQLRHLGAHRAAADRRADGEGRRHDPHPARRRGRAPRLGLAPGQRLMPKRK